MLFRRLPKNLEQRMFDLTLALYRVTDLFPRGEILRKHLREKANEVFSQTLEYNYASDQEGEALKIVGRIESIKGYLGIAKSLQIVKPINLVILEREYVFLADFFAKKLEFLNQTDKPVRTAYTSVGLGVKEERITEKEEKELGEQDSNYRQVEKLENETISRRDDAVVPERYVQEESPYGRSPEGRQRRNRPFSSFPSGAGEFDQSSLLLVAHVPQGTHRSSFLEYRPNSLRSTDASSNPALLSGQTAELRQFTTEIAGGGQPNLNHRVNPVRDTEHRIPEEYIDTAESGNEQNATTIQISNGVNWQGFSGVNPDSPLLLNERQEAILEHLKRVESVKVSDFYSFFSNISSKTIQRDLQDLVAKNLLKREGEKRWTIYHLNANVR